MTTGDEPMLSQPQPGDDNAPMISSVETRAIADLRGAYLAGNLRALIERMDEAQQFRFRQAMVKLGLWLHDQAVFRRESDPPPSEPFFDVFYDLIEQWSQQPSEAIVERIRALLFPRNTFVCFPVVWHYVLGRLVEPLDHARLYSTAQEVLELGRDWVYDPPLEVTAAEQRAVQQWQLDAAWAILHGNEPALRFASPTTGNEPMLSQHRDNPTADEH